MPASWLERATDDASPNVNNADVSSDGNQEYRTAPAGVVVRTQQGRASLVMVRLLAHPQSTFILLDRDDPSVVLVGI